MNTGTIKDRLLQFIEYKDISKRNFCEQIKVSHTYLNDLKTMQSDKIETISGVFPELNLVWLVTGKGEMINTKQGSGTVNDTSEDEVEYTNRGFPNMESIVRKIVQDEMKKGKIM